MSIICMCCVKARDFMYVCLLLRHKLLPVVWKINSASINTRNVKRAQNAKFFLSLQSHDISVEITSLISITFLILILQFKLSKKLNFFPVVQFMRT